MADLKVINLADKKEYTIDVQKNGENQMTCPECSPGRKKSTPCIHGCVCGHICSLQ